MRTITSLFLAGLFLCTTACGNKTTETVPGTLPQNGKSFATVNGKKLTQETIDAILERIPASKRAEYLEQGIVSQMEEQLITTEIIYQKAIEANMHKASENKITLALAQREVLVNSYLQKEIDAVLTDEKLQEAYTERTVRYQKTEADLSALALTDLEKAKELKKLLDEGADFAKIVQENAEDPQAKATGGKMGKMNLANLPPQIKDPLSKAKDGDVIGPISLGGKHTLIKAHTVVSSITPFEEVKESLKEELSREESKNIVEKLKSEAKIDHKGKADAAKIEVPKTETPKTEAPKTEAPKSETPKTKEK